MVTDRVLLDQTPHQLDTRGSKIKDKMVRGVGVRVGDNSREAMIFNIFV